MKQKFTTRSLAYIGLMAALVFVGNYLRFKAMLPNGGVISLHFGNIPCLLAGLLLGPIPGGLASGIGGLIFDLLDPIYAPLAWITFIIKFFLGFSCGLVAHGAGGLKGLSTRRRVGAVVAGSLVQMVLYIIKSFFEYRFVLGLSFGPAVVALLPNLATSAMNAVVACVAAVPLSVALQRALKPVK